MATSHVVASHITKLLSSFRQILEFRFRENQQERIPPWKVTKTKPFLSTCYGDPSATEVPPCFEAATRKLTFSTTSVLLLLDVPLSLSRGTIFRRQKNPRRGYRPKIAGILFVCNEPGRSIPYCALIDEVIPMKCVKIGIIWSPHMKEITSWEQSMILCIALCLGDLPNTPRAHPKSSHDCLATQRS